MIRWPLVVTSQLTSHWLQSPVTLKDESSKLLKMMDGFRVVLLPLTHVYSTEPFKYFVFSVFPAFFN